MYVHLKRKKKSWICKSIGDHHTPVIVWETRAVIDRAAWRAACYRLIRAQLELLTTSSRQYFILNECTFGFTHLHSDCITTATHWTISGPILGPIRSLVTGDYAFEYLSEYPSSKWCQRDSFIVPSWEPTKTWIVNDLRTIYDYTISRRAATVASPATDEEPTRKVSTRLYSTSLDQLITQDFTNVPFHIPFSLFIAEKHNESHVILHISVST